MITYSIFDLCQIQDEDLSKIESAYELWHQTYEPIFQAAKQVLIPDYFWRSRLLAVLFQDNQIMAIHLYNGFNILCDSQRKHSYFFGFPAESLKKLESSQNHKMMSAEFLTVHPDFRGRRAEVPWSDVMVGLCAKVFLHSSWDVVVGVSRTDYKVDDLTSRHGASSIGQATRHQVDCQVMVAERSQIVPNKNPIVNQWVSQLWGSANIKTYLLNLNQQKLKVAS